MRSGNDDVKCMRRTKAESVGETMIVHENERRKKEKNRSSSVMRFNLQVSNFEELSKLREALLKAFRKAEAYGLLPRILWMVMYLAPDFAVETPTCALRNTNSEL